MSDWSNGTGDWSGSSDWSVVDGHAFSGGAASYFEGAKPDFTPLFSLPSGDLTIQARIRLVRFNPTIGAFETFGITARATANGSDAFGMCDDCSGGPLVGLSTSGFEHPLAQHPFDPRNAWHDYRVEFRGAQIIGFVDTIQVFDVVETDHADGDVAGLWASGSVVEVASFTVIRP